VKGVCLGMVWGKKQGGSRRGVNGGEHRRGLRKAGDGCHWLNRGKGYGIWASPGVEEGGWIWR